MPRTAEQKAADDALREAVWGVIKAMHPTPQPGQEAEPSEAAGVLTKFIVLAVQMGFDAEGDSTDAFNILYSDGSMPMYEAEGLVKMADRSFAGRSLRQTHGRAPGEE